MDPLPSHCFAMLAEDDSVGNDAAARAANGQGRGGYGCEAAFYIGELQLLRNDPKGARASLQGAVKTCPHTFDEYHAAVAELSRLP